MINYDKKTHQVNGLGAVLYKSESPYVLRGFVPELSKFVGLLLLGRSLKDVSQDQKLNDMISYLLALGVQAYYRTDRSPFEKLDLVLSGNVEFFERRSISSRLNLNLFRPDVSTVAYSKYVTDIGTSNMLLDLQPMSDTFELIFPTIIDQIYLADVIKNVFAEYKKAYQAYASRIPSSTRSSKTAFEVLKDSLVPFYNTFKITPNIQTDAGYLQTILLSFLLCDLATCSVGTLKDFLFLIIPKSFERTESKFVEKILFTTCFRQVKAGIREKVKIDNLKSYGDAQTIFDCSLSFLGVLDLAQKLKDVQLRFEGSEFIDRKTEEILDKTNAEALLYKLGFSAKAVPQKPVSGMLRGVDEVKKEHSLDITKGIKALITIQILLLDSYVKDYSFYSEMLLTNEGILKLISSIPRFSGVAMSKLSQDFLKVARAMFKEWDVRAWNADGSVRDAKNILLFPVAGAKGPHDNMQLSPAACDLTPLNSLSLEDHDRGLNAFLGKTNFEVFKGMRDTVFTSSAYFNYRIASTYQDVKGIPKALDPGIIYLFLIYCEFVINTYVLDHAILFSEDDILEQPPYDRIKDVERYATKDPLIRKALIALGITLTVFTVKKTYDKIKRKSRKKE